jgi:signal peptidase
VLLLLLAPLLLLLIGVAVKLGGGWLALIPPASLVLLWHARLVCRFPLRSWGGAAGDLGLLVALTAVATLVVGPVFGLYRTVTVLSGSMRPTFNPGDMIIVSPEPMRDLLVGEVITFQIPTVGHPVETHRVVSILRAGSEPIVRTKGDANNAVDPWQAELHGPTLWRYRFRLPALGYPLLLLRSPWIHWATTLLLPLLLALWGLARLWRPAHDTAATNA